MSFIGGDKDAIKFVLTPYGKKTLAEKGLANSKMYYTLFDDEVIYTVNVFPTLISDINGVENKISAEINYRNKLT